MPRVAFLSTDNLEDFFVYDELLIPHFEQRGWSVDTVSWHCQKTDWSAYDAVIVRSTWDYQNAPDAFVDCLKRIEQSGTLLENPLELMLWNIQKIYLKELEEAGIPVIPTVWMDAWSTAAVETQFAALNTDTLVIKPVLSANADDTFRLTPQALAEKQGTLSALFSQRPFMVQPFIREVVDEGEISLFYFDGDFSHAILKQPAVGDFRVQEEHGGRLSVLQPDATVMACARAALNAMPASALYARVDLIRAAGQWRVMELELIEPSLYFQLDEGAAPRFVDAFLQRWRQQRA
ncbi:ATP-grasp domain-containing protein [Alteromonas sp. CYL-A6]|uniref:ATP-grasp domain-containing protein n=1 Tax=Alteromonas nitratireducens TaxID=3390813 RepID=UPI0034BC7DC2